MRVGDGSVTIRYAPRRTADGRDVYQYTIRQGRRRHTAADLSSGVGGGTLRQGMASLLSFLGAAAESYSYRMRTGRAGENEDLFPPWVVEWAYQNSDEIAMRAEELEG